MQVESALAMFARGWHTLSAGLFDRFTPRCLAEQPDDLRRARLILGFAVLGGIFGAGFGAFYLAIGHPWGAGVIAICCTCFTFIPFILRKYGSTERAGNLYCLVLNGGFFALCWVEGGIRGHALAWLVTVPLLALLLTSRRAAYLWGGVAFGGAAVVGGAGPDGRNPKGRGKRRFFDYKRAAFFISPRDGLSRASTIRT